MTGREITAQAIAETREAVREQNRLAALPLSEAIERARQRVYARAAAGAKPVVPLALQTALAADALPAGGLRPTPARTIVPPEEKTPERVQRRGKTTALGVLIRGAVRGAARGAVLPGAKVKEDSRHAYASGQNYLDRQVPPERERGEE